MAARSHTVTLVMSDHLCIGYLLQHGPGPDEGVVDAFSASGDLLGCYDSRASAAAEIARQGVWHVGAVS